MPPGKYYCDYCEKLFQDTPSFRKRHLQGFHHQRAKKLWFDSFIDQAQPQPQPQPQPRSERSCTHFVETGVCQYGNNCIFFHPVQTIQQRAGVFPEDQRTNQVSLSLMDLPPSLRPPPGGGYQPPPFVDWG